MSQNVTIHFLAQKSDDRPRTQMMSFLIITENGKVIAIDGGNKPDTEDFHGYIEALLGPNPHIDFWFLTHPHDDHIDVLCEMLRRFPNDFTIGKLIYNFPPFEFIDQYENYEAHTTAEFREMIPVLQRKGTELCEAKTGEIYSLDGVTFEILRTYDPAITIAMQVSFNDTDDENGSRCGYLVLNDAISNWWDSPKNLSTYTLAEYAEPVIEVVETETVTTAPQTFDAGIVAAVAAIVSAAGYAISKKR